MSYTHVLIYVDFMGEEIIEGVFSVKKDAEDHGDHLISIRRYGHTERYRVESYALDKYT